MDLCAPPVTGALGPSRDLYCIDLSATDRGGAASGTVSLEYVPGPFTVPVTVDGSYRYALVITLRGLPPTPPGTGYVDWAAKQAMSAIKRLSVGQHGGNPPAQVAL